MKYKMKHLRYDFYSIRTMDASSLHLMSLLVLINPESNENGEQENTITLKMHFFQINHFGNIQYVINYKLKS